MAKKHTPPSITSAEASQSDDTAEREKRYMITMAIRMVCLALMLLVQPFGWHTLIFFLGAAFLPYVAVINANNGSARKTKRVSTPEAAVTAAAPADAAATASDDPLVIRLDPEVEPPRREAE